MREVNQLLSCWGGGGEEGGGERRGCLLSFVNVVLLKKSLEISCKSSICSSLWTWTMLSLVCVAERPFIDVADVVAEGSRYTVSERGWGGPG